MEDGFDSYGFDSYELYCMSLEDFEILEKLGSGSIGTIMLAEYKNNGRLYVLKFVDPEYTDFIQEGLDICENIKHPNLVRCYGYFKDLLENNVTVIVMEFIQGYDLYYMHVDNHKYNLDQVIVQLVHGLKYLHGLGYIHRDIKLENIVMDLKGNIKIIDYD